MEDIKLFWSGLGARARFGLMIGCGGIVVACLVLGYFLTKPRYEPLFSGLSTRERAATLTVLEKDKVPFVLSEVDGAILVPVDQVQKLRLKLAGSELPIQGGVGFELFNSSEVGMTDFAQKITYQRALQGELTRTIMSLDEVQSARVHLALPEQGLFRRAGASTQPKASVVLTLKAGRELKRDQTRGIQRMVAAAIPDVKPEDVTVLDQRGVALTVEQGGPESDGLAAFGVDGKRDSEDYLGRKVRDVLDQMFGPGQSIARIDVVLNQDHTKVTTESVLPAITLPGQQRQVGVVVRETESGEPEVNGNATNGKITTSASDPIPVTRSREVQYQVGRRVEQIVSGPGTISRINVAVFVRRRLDAKQTEHLKELVAASIGLDRQRGDNIAIHSADEILGVQQQAGVETQDVDAASGANQGKAKGGTAADMSLAVAKSQHNDFESTLRSAGIAVALLCCAIVAVGVWGMRRRRAGVSAVAAAVPAMSADQREAVLRDVKDWMRADGQSIREKS